MSQPRVIIIGAGPSGVRCAQTRVAVGLRPTVIDENRRDGGPICRRQPANFSRPCDQLCGTESGATDRLIPVNGRQLAGTYSLSAAQIALKAQACAIGRRNVSVPDGRSFQAPWH